jgi:hypothetical protein
MMLTTSLANSASAGFADDLMKNPNFSRMWQSTGPCNRVNSRAWNQVLKNGKWIDVESHPLDCNMLIAMVMANGRISYLFGDGNKGLGFGTDGVPQKDEERRLEYVTVEHLYPYDFPFWEPVRRAAARGQNGMIGSNVYGRCMRTPHKNNPEVTVVLCVANYMPDKTHVYNWAIEITEEKIVTLK